MRFSFVSSAFAILAFAVMGCGGDGGSATDGGSDSAIGADGATDSATLDSSATDSGATDSGADADGSTSDAGSDSATLDASTGDAGTDAATTDSAVGSSCSAASPCTGGAVCIGGPACGDTWTCAFSGIACTDDVVAFCGCDGSTFTGSSTCVTLPVAHLGSCEAGANCDRSAVTCRRVEPVCPDGQVGEVEGTCWTGRCVAISECACTTAAECPMSDIYTCHRTRGRCGPYL